LSKTTLATISGLGAAAVGLLYTNYVFGPTEAEVASWGQISFYGGLGLVVLSVIARRLRLDVLRVVLVPLLSVMALIQVPPAILWILFHGSGISDGSPPTSFVAHWSISLPHLAIIGLCFASVYQLLRRKPISPA